MNKEFLRKDILVKRIEFAAQPEFDKVCLQICKQIELFLSTLPYQSKNLIGGYFAIEGEVNLNNLYNHLPHLAFPRLIFVKNTSEIEYAKVSSVNELTQSKLSFKEPSKEASICFPDIILVPGICYDKQHNRLGYGMGHFDKFIANASKSNYTPIKVGVCFDFQLKNSIQKETHDQIMDVIITESKII